jgi:hypothetical protein
LPESRFDFLNPISARPALKSPHDQPPNNKKAKDEACQKDDQQQRPQVSKHYEPKLGVE